MFKCLNVKYQMSMVNKVKLLSERTSGVPPVIFTWIYRNTDFGGGVNFAFSKRNFLEKEDLGSDSSK